MIERRAQSKIVLHLSKPWKMGEALGWPSMPASVDYQEGDRWLIELEKPFRFGKSEYRFFVVEPRLEGWHLGDAESREVPCRIVPTAEDQLSSDHPCEIPRRRNGIPIVGSITDYHH